MPPILRDICKTHVNDMRTLDRVGPTMPAGMYGLPGSVGAEESTRMRVLTPQDADGGSAMFDEPGVLHRENDDRRAAP